MPETTPDTPIPTRWRALVRVIWSLFTAFRMTTPEHFQDMDICWPCGRRKM